VVLGSGHLYCVVYLLVGSIGVGFNLSCCVVVGVWYWSGGHQYWVVWLLVCGMVVGVNSIRLCGCWCVVLRWGSIVLCCVDVEVWYGGMVYHYNDCHISLK